MKKAHVLSIALILLLLCMATTAVACTDLPLSHSHTYDTAWQYDPFNHWHAANCEHTDKVSGISMHAFDEGAVKTAPTEQTDGIKSFSCTVCGYIKAEVIPKLSHTHAYTERITPPTCTEAGYTVYSCACGDSYTDGEVIATDHAWGAPVETSNGTYIYRCDNDSKHTVSADCTYTSADGYALSQFDNRAETDYTDALEAYGKEGYTVYSTSCIGELITTTLVRAAKYRTVAYNRTTHELYLGASADGAVLPTAVTDLGMRYEITVTQRHSTEINGMTYIVRLADGSFLVVDGGYTSEAQSLYDTLCELNGSAGGIHIRAWMLTHSHNDHYQAFSQFSKEYASLVTLDCVLYAPVSGASGQDTYLNTTVKTDIARFSGAKLCGIHTGTVLTFGEVSWEILLTPEHLYKKNAPSDFNETSIVSRIKTADGSLLLLADCGVNACKFLIDTYGDALKSDMVQIAHHGCETATAELYDTVQAATCFWPCNQRLFSSYRGEYVKQHILEADYAKEHLLHSYGTITRPLSHKATAPTTLSLLPTDITDVTVGPYAEGARIEDGVLCFDTKSVGDAYDPYVSFLLNGVRTTEYNALRIVINSEACNTSSAVFFTCGSDVPGRFTSVKSSYIGVTGASEDGKTTMIAFLGDIEGYIGDLSSLRLDFGAEDGQTVRVYSIEAFYVDLDG